MHADFYLQLFLPPRWPFSGLITDSLADSNLAKIKQDSSHQAVKLKIILCDNH